MITRIRLALTLAVLAMGALRSIGYLLQGDGLSSIVTLMLASGVALLIVPTVDT